MVFLVTAQHLQHTFTHQDTGNVPLQALFQSKLLISREQAGSPIPFPKTTQKCRFEIDLKNQRYAESNKGRGYEQRRNRKNRHRRELLEKLPGV